MRTGLFIIIMILSGKFLFGQNECIKHWTKNATPNLKIDSILATIKFDGVDSIPSSEYDVNDPFDYTLYINFYTEQLGNYFSDASSVNLAKKYYKRSTGQTYDQIVIVQFELPKQSIRTIKSVYGKGYDGYRYFKLKEFTLYKYVIKGNNIYYISTQSYHPGEKESFLDKVSEVFNKYKE